MKLYLSVRGEGFPLLCLHGHPGSGQSMSVFTTHLASRFKTLAPDLRGYGASRTQQPFQMIDHLQDLEELLDTHQIERCLVLGWSLGGILAMELALRLPERISGLILVATAARPRGCHPATNWGDDLYTAIASVLNRIRPGWQWNIQTFGQRSLYRYLIRQHTPVAYRYLAEEALTAYLQTSRWATQALSMALNQGYDRLPDLQQIQCPCLMLAGEADCHITMAASRETASSLPNCEWQSYANVAHLFPWEIPRQVQQDIDRWLENHPQMTRIGPAKLPGWSNGN